MTILRRMAAFLAILAALLAAPSAASAVAPNQLLEPVASPTSGDITTLFHLSVRYRSTGNPATAVSVSVAGLVLPMSLASGTPVDGTWSSATVLPAGSWPVTFHASVTKGPQPRLTGPIVSVAGPLATAAPPTSTPSWSGSSVSAVDPTSAPGTPAPAPGTSPSAMASPATPAATAPTGSDSGNATGGSSGGSTGGAGAPASTAQPAGPSEAGPGASERRDAAEPIGGPSTPSLGGDIVWTVLLVGLLGVAAIAILGSIWVFLGRDRKDGEQVASDPSPSTAPGAATVVLGRRALRRAQLETSNDPILAALGLGGADDGKPATQPPRGQRSRPRQVSTGPGERPVHRARPPRDRDW